MVSCIRNKILLRLEVTTEALQIIILNHCYFHFLSLVSQMSVNYVRRSCVTACCYAKQDFNTCAIPILMTLFPFPLVAQKLLPFPWKFPFPYTTLLWVELSNV